MVTREEIRKILTDHHDSILSDFDDYLCYQKYGEEKFLKGDFKIDDDDRKILSKINQEHKQTAARKIKDKGDEAIKVLKEIITTEGYAGIKDFANEISQLIS
ncbi:MAG: hypothetical protein GPJ52_04525 [Candidatus Heimdallarchaeota archaeon]|nr:hypothetical protein [Candidatus Heimdallarchaeota archaeon]